MRHSVRVREPMPPVAAVISFIDGINRGDVDHLATLMADPDLLPEDHRSLVATEGLARTVTDYIAGMTDNFIEQTWADLNAR